MRCRRGILRQGAEIRNSHDANRAHLFGDDEPLVDRYMVSIDVYVPLDENYRAWVDGFHIAMESEFDDVTYDGSTVDTEAEKRHLMFNGLTDIIRG